MDSPRDPLLRLLAVASLGTAAICGSANPGLDDSSARAQLSVANWDKGGALSHWVYTHPAALFPAAVVRRSGPIKPPERHPSPRVGQLVVSDPPQRQTLDQLVANGAVDACIVLHHDTIVYEKYPNGAPDELHLSFSVTKAVVLAALAILEDEGSIDLQRSVDSYLPELKGSGWDGVPLADATDMRSGVEGAEDGNDAYRNPAHPQFQLEATLGLQLRTAPELPAAARTGDLPAFLATIRRKAPPGTTWAYTSSNSAVVGEVISRVTHRSLADVIGERIWSRMGAEHDALLLQNERGYPIAHAGMAMTLRDLARFGQLFLKSSTTARNAVIPERVMQRAFHRRGAADVHGMLPLTYQWDLVTDQGELAKGGWAGQLLYVNREKDVVVAWFGTNLTADPALEPLPARMIARLF